MARPCLTGVIDYAYSSWELHLRGETDVGAITHVPYSTEAKECLYFSVYNEGASYNKWQGLTFTSLPYKQLHLSIFEWYRGITTKFPGSNSLS
jgi:hypothetical protein